LYYYGVDVKQNAHLAFKYFNLAAEHKNAEAYFCLGEMYEQGVGVAKHLPTAYEWFKKAADEGGLAKAQFKIGKMLYFGEGVKKNIAQGVNYIKLAFNNGYPTAMQFWNENQLWRYEQ
ncbi:MAG: tetratricopeptide repeat protein, partial [Bacteroidales bacterium]|nr:tetratricopeptide repeat protein [Bacteroidales bacterium]